MFRFAVFVACVLCRAALTAALALLSSSPLSSSAGVPTLDDGQTFAIREGGRTVGAGTVTALLD